MGIPGTCGNYCLTEAKSYPVTLTAAESFIGLNDASLIGSVSSDSTYLTAALLGETSLELQITCISSGRQHKSTSTGKPLRLSGSSSKCTLNIILYGPIELSPNIDEFIHNCNEHLDDMRKLYLQDPVGCDRNVRYCNPHRLPRATPEVFEFTFDLALKYNGIAQKEDAGSQPELLELLDSQENLPEALQPPLISTPLER